MFHTATKKAPIEISEDDPAQQENTLHARKTLKVIQHQGAQKENLTIRQSLKPVEHEAKKKKTANKGVQTGESSKVTVTAEDLTNDTPSDDYWRLLAEARGCALDNSFRENENLKEEVDHWKRENLACRALIEESRELIDVLQETLASKNEEDNDEEEDGEGQVEG